MREPVPVAPGSEVGVIGLGLVGSALCERLLAAGREVVGFDIDPARIAGLRRMGGAAAGCAAQVAHRCRRVILSLPTSEVAACVIEDIQSHLAPGAVIIDTTTGDPDAMAGFGADLRKRDVLYLDATIGGSSGQLLAGEALIMCGGEAEAFAACWDLLETCSGKVFHVGSCGAGARMKLVFNLVLGLNRAVLAEGLAYASACGIEPATALEILKAGPAYSKVMDTKGQRMVSAEFTPEARLSQHLKDVRLILDSARRSNAVLPLSTLHCSLLEQVEAAGYGSADNSAIIKAFEPNQTKR